MSDGRCPHMLCCRTAYERDLSDAECALDDCPFKPSKPSLEEIERRVAELTSALKQAEGRA